MAKKKPETKEAPAAKAPVVAEAAVVTPAAQPIAAPAPTEVHRATEAHGTATTAAVVQSHGFRRKLVGRVTSSKMNKTVVVEVVRSSRDQVYKKYVRSRDRYKAHDETNQYKVGDRVEIQEHRPISRDKRWLVTRLVSRAVEE
jgi:small subunit ribosomal protein S17